MFASLDGKLVCLLILELIRIRIWIRNLFAENAIILCLSKEFEIVHLRKPLNLVDHLLIGNLSVRVATEVFKVLIN